jgi:hypothetical protein
MIQLAWAQHAGGANRCREQYRGDSRGLGEHSKILIVLMFRFEPDPSYGCPAAL